MNGRSKCLSGLVFPPSKECFQFRKTKRNHMGQGLGNTSGEAKQLLFLSSKTFKTSGRVSFLIILFQFLQYYVFVVLSGDAFALFHWHFYCDSFTREEDCIQNILCPQRTFGNYWAFAVFSGPDLIANLSDGPK